MEINLLNDDIFSYRNLWIAVLLNAKNDLEKEANKYKNKSSIIKFNNNSALYWFNNDHNEEIGSFKWICELLNIDFKRVRTKIFSLNQIKRKVKICPKK